MKGCITGVEAYAVSGHELGLVGVDHHHGALLVLSLEFDVLGGVMMELPSVLVIPHEVEEGLCADHHHRHHHEEVMK